MLALRPSLAVCLACAALGCERDAPADGAPSPTVAAPTIPQAEPARRAVIKKVQWPARQSIDLDARQRLSEAARTAVDQSPAPVLVPAAKGLLPNATVIAKEHWVAVSSHDDGLTVSLHGKRLAYRYDHIKPVQGRHRIRGTAAYVSQDRRIWSVSWTEHGVAYSLDLECARGDDPRCDDERHLVKLAAGLAYVGGVGASGGAP